MSDIRFSIHWLAFTVHAPEQAAWDLYSVFFEDEFGAMLPKKSGGRGYREIYSSTFEFKIYIQPVVEEMIHFHIEIPGQACELIPLELYLALLNYLEKHHPDKFTFKRLDLAFDNVPFSPEDVMEAFRQEKVRTLAKRDNVTCISSPYKLRDDGQVGTATTDIGSNESKRKVTVYNKRGFTRLEYRAKDERADWIARELFTCSDFARWFPIGLAHLRDYVDFETEWWVEFIGGVARAKVIVSSPREMSVEKKVNWLVYQVAPSLSLIHAVHGDRMIETLIEHGRIRRGRQYDHLIPDNDGGQD